MIPPSLLLDGADHMRDNTSVGSIESIVFVSLQVLMSREAWQPCKIQKGFVHNASSKPSSLRLESVLVLWMT